MCQKIIEKNNQLIIFLTSKQTNKNNYFVSLHYLYIFNQLNHSQDDDVYHLFLDLNLLIPEPEPVLMQKEFLFVKFFKCSSSKTLELLKRILLKCIIDKQKFENILLDVFFYYLEDEASSVKEELLQIVLKENLFTQNLHFKTKLQQNSKHLESLNGIIQKEFIQLVVCQKISLIIEFYFKILPILTKKNLTKFFWEITKIISKYDQDELVVFVKEFFEKNYTVQLSTKQWNQLCHDLLKHCLPHKAADCLFFLTLQETYTILKNSEEYFLNILKYLNFLERDRRTFFVLRVIHLLDSPTRAHEIDFFFFLQNHLQWLMNNDPTIIQANDVEKILEVLNAKNKYVATWKIDDVVLTSKVLTYGTRTKFKIFCSLENLSFIGDHIPTIQNYTLFDWVKWN